MVDRALQSAGGGGEARLWEAYAHHVRAFLDLSGEKKPLKVVIDASNGMAGTMIPMIFGKKSPLGPVAGLEIIEISFENSKGEFVHEPNPLVTANLAMARERRQGEGRHPVCL